VVESIKQCGYVAPIIVDEDGVILAGHTRYKALKKLGRSEAEVIVREGLNEKWKK
jgi:ParB-like chromosome segregation protein Spo0J